MNYYNLTDIAREAGYCILPKEGAWVCIMGCPLWQRGQRLIKTHQEIGIRHMDVYWAYKEKCCYPIRVNRFQKRKLELPVAVAYDISRGIEPDEALSRAVEDLQNFVEQSPVANSLQHSKITINHPYPEEVRFYNGEIRVFDTKIIRLLLEENALEIIPFGETVHIALEDAVRELIEAYQLDGLTWAQAYQEVLGLGIVEPEGFIPQWFYRPRGWFRDQFCEELE